MFKEVHEILGIPLKAEKNQGPAARLDLLGMEIAATSLWSGLRLTPKRRAGLQTAVDSALRARHLSAREAQRLGGQLSFASGAFFGRVGRAFAPVVSHHKGGWTPQLEHALGWWQALLRVPLNFYQEHGRPRVRAMAWVDGSWETETSTGAVGAVLFVEGAGQWSLSKEVPAGLRHELLRLGKEQRNTQAELLAVLMLLLSKPAELRGTLLEIWEDNTAALYNILSGSAGDEQSRELVAAIWMIAAALRVHIWIGYVPSESNSSDPFSRPTEVAKQREAAELAQLFQLRATEPVLPASIRAKPAVWAAAVGAASKPGAWRDRAAQTRRKGLVGAATHFHADLTRVLCAAFRQQCPNQRCTSIVLAKGRSGNPPCGAGLRLASVCVGPGECTWSVGGKQLAPSTEGAVVAQFFEVSGAAGPACRHEAALAKYGFPM